MRRGVTSTVVVAVIAVLAACALLIWGSSNGAPLVGSPQGSWEPPRISLPPLGEPSAVTTEPAQQGEADDMDPGPVIDWVLIGFALLVATALMIVLRSLLRRPGRDLQPLSTEEDDELAALLEATGADVRYRALSETDPRNAVVACWVALEEAVQRSGLHRDPTETASELTSRVLGHWQVEESAIRDLSAAYREARFSRHEVTEQERDRAIAALKRIHEDLRQRVLEEQIRTAEAAEAASAKAAEAEAAASDATERPRR